MEIGLAAEAAVAFEGALGFASSLQDQIEVRSRIIQAHRMTGNRTAILQNISRLRALQEIPEQGQHDEIEILELDTLKRTTSDVASLNTRVRACVDDASLPAYHRVSAAVVSFKVASARGDLDEMRRVYRLLQPLLSDDTVDTRSQIRLEVIYHTMCGDLTKALRLAKEIVALEEGRGVSSSLLTAMTDLSYVMIRTEQVGEIVPVLKKAYAIAIEHKFFAHAREIAGRLLSFFENQRLPGSSEWVLRAAPEENTPIPDRFSYNVDLTRIALRENRLADAKELLQNGFDWDWLSPRPSWLAAALALRVKLRIGQLADREIALPDVVRLRRLYKRIAPLGVQDYEIEALVRGLVYVGDPASAATCLTDYVGRTRRDSSPLSRDLMVLVRKLNVECRGLPGAGRRERRRQNIGLAGA